jgi:hypothetical protein
MPTTKLFYNLSVKVAVISEISTQNKRRFFYNNSRKKKKTKASREDDIPEHLRLANGCHHYSGTSGLLFSKILEW